MEVHVVRVREVLREDGSFKTKEPEGNETSETPSEVPADEAAILKELEEASLSRTIADAETRENPIFVNTVTQTDPLLVQTGAEVAEIKATDAAAPFASVVTPIVQVEQGSRVAATTGNHLASQQAREPFTVPGYSIIELLGEGALCEVYLVKQDTAGALFAAKTLVHVANCRSGIGRLREEALKINLLRGSKDVSAEVKELFPVVAFEQIGTQRYALMMEYVPKTLRSWLESKPTLDAVLDSFLDIARGVEAMHKVVGIHGDIKIEAFGLTEAGRVKFIDLNLKWTDERFDHVKSLVQSIEAKDQERLRQIQGTAPYMAPEQWEGHADVRTDVYQLSLLLEDMLVHIIEPFPQIKLIIERGRSRKSEARFPSVNELIQAIEQTVQHRAPSQVKAGSSVMSGKIRVAESIETTVIPAQSLLARFLSRIGISPISRDEIEPKLSPKLARSLDEVLNCKDPRKKIGIATDFENYLIRVKSISFADLAFICKGLPTHASLGMSNGLKGSLKLSEILTYRAINEAGQEAEFEVSVNREVVIFALALEKARGAGGQKHRDLRIDDLCNTARSLIEQATFECLHPEFGEQELKKSQVKQRLLDSLNTEVADIWDYLCQSPSAGLNTLRNEFQLSTGRKSHRAKNFILSLHSYVQNASFISLADLLFIVRFVPTGVSTNRRLVYFGDDNRYVTLDIAIIVDSLSKLRITRGTSEISEIRDRLPIIVGRTLSFSSYFFQRPLKDLTLELLVQRLEEIKQQFDAT